MRVVDTTGSVAMYVIQTRERRAFKREVCFLIGHGGAILWADIATSPLAMPDSRVRFEAIWAHRALLEEITHSHPVGPRAFSHEDETTMDALDRALGRRLRYS